MLDNDYQYPIYQYYPSINKMLSNTQFICIMVFINSFWFLYFVYLTFEQVWGEAVEMPAEVMDRGEEELPLFNFDYLNEEVYIVEEAVNSKVS